MSLRRVCNRDAHRDCTRGCDYTVPHANRTRVGKNGLCPPYAARTHRKTGPLKKENKLAVLGQ